MARITIELEPSDIDKLLDLQHEMFDALLRIERGARHSWVLSG